MNAQRNGRKTLFTTTYTFVWLIVGCVAEDQASIASTLDPMSALIGFAVDFGRQILAAFLF